MVDNDKKNLGKEGENIKGIYEEQGPSSSSQIKEETHLYIKFSTIFHNICFKFSHRFLFFE